MVEIKEVSVMVCDDSALVRKKTKEMLIRLGCEDVYEAKDGQEAIDNYKEFRPDLVLMDIVMPVKTGLEAVEEIMYYDEDAKIVMVSSTGTKANLREALELGAYEFIQKPVEELALKNLLDKYVEEGR